jgi:glycosyltransferase involved in cell wall biosynthesis
MNRPKLLHLVPYTNFVPPRNGGALRCYYLCVELANYFEVTLLTLQPNKSINDEGFKDIKIVNPVVELKVNGFINKVINAVKYRWFKRSVKGPAQATVLQFYPLLKSLSKTTSFDYVLMEHLDGIELGLAVKRFFPNAIRIADQHNVDHLLFKQYHNLEFPQNIKEYNYLKRQESNLHLNADILFTCSKEDLLTLKALNKDKIQAFVVPNGTSLKQINNLNAKPIKNRLLFCGALDTTPNKNGLLWFYNRIWPVLKQSLNPVSLTVVGRNGNDTAYEPLKQDSQINFIGEVDDVSEYYANSDIALVPLLEGSGTRLKILEAMSFGIPVVSTSIGAEGIDYSDGKNILIANGVEAFTKTIMDAITQEDIIELISKNGLLLVQQKYDWVKIVRDTSIILKNFA